jgi:hypothetical protein
MAAMLQTSVLAPHLAPRITSGERYCRVWMSLVKWWFTQQALPRSAILTEMMSNGFASSALRFSPVPGVLSSEMPDTWFVIMSAVRSRCLCLSSLDFSRRGEGVLDFELLPVAHTYHVSLPMVYPKVGNGGGSQCWQLTFL